MLHLVLCWHFHQPDYRDADGRYQLPWTYLHAVKDYADMAAHLEAAPNISCVVNFVPTLTAQLEDYVLQFETGDLRDPLLARLVDPHLAGLSVEDKRHLVAQCFKINHATMLEPFPAYRRLYTLWKTVEESGEAGLAYLSGQFLADLVTWYHLVWTGETVRRGRPELLALMNKGEGFTLADRQALFELYAEVISNLLPRYRALAQRGQIELSATPHSHPILPLLLDFAAAREARPDLPVPQAPGYPGGQDRARFHVEAAIADHQAHFGLRPTGFWPAEGGVSEASIRLLSEAGIQWAASGEGVLRHSLTALGADLGAKAAWSTTPYRIPGAGTALFFRDDHLSDLIGFEYKGWFGADAVRHFIHALEEVRRHAPGTHPVVSIILDGENAWEYYPYNGYYFLDDLYGLLESHPAIRTTTYSDVLADDGSRGFPVLRRLVAGSWVYGDLSTWIGHRDKNRAWDLLCDAKRLFDRVLSEGRLSARQRDQASRQLGVCEGSDWCWWFGDHNPAESVRAIDAVYRASLARLYELLGEPVPEELSVPVSLGGAGDAKTLGSMHRAG